MYSKAEALPECDQMPLKVSFTDKQKGLTAASTVLMPRRGMWQRLNHVRVS
jgi:hypothetical protein